MARFENKLKTFTSCSGITRDGDGVDKWINADGSETLLKWRPNEPNDFGGDEDCVEFYPHSPFGMNDINCSSEKHIFRCRIENTANDFERVWFNNLNGLSTATHGINFALTI